MRARQATFRYLPMLEVFRALLRHHRAGRRPHARARRSPAACCCSTTASARSLPLLFDFLGVPDPERPVPRIDPDAQAAPALRRAAPASSSARAEAAADGDADRGPALARRRQRRVPGAVGRRRRRHARLLLVNFRPEYHADWMQQVVLPAAAAGAARAARRCASCSHDLLGTDPSIAALAERDPRAHRRQSVLHRGGGAVADRVGAPRRASAAPIGWSTPIETLEVPATVQAVLAARIDRLPEREKQVLQTAAVIGKDFAEPLLGGVLAERRAERRAAGGRWRALRARQAEFVYEQALYPVAEYAFKHPLTQEVALRHAAAGAPARACTRRWRGRSTRAHAEQARRARGAAGASLGGGRRGLASRALAPARGRVGRGHQRRRGRAALGARAQLAAAAPAHHGSPAARGHRVRLGTSTWPGGSARRPPMPRTSSRKAGASPRRAGDVRAQAALHGAYGARSASWAETRTSTSTTASKRRDSPTRPTIRACSSPQRAFLAFGCIFAGRLAEGLESCETACRTLPADPALGVEFTGYSPFLGILMAQAWILARLGRLDESTAVCDRAEQLARAHGDSRGAHVDAAATHRGGRPSRRCGRRAPPRPLLRWRRARNPPPRNRMFVGLFVSGSRIGSMPRGTNPSRCWKRRCAQRSAAPIACSKAGSAPSWPRHCSGVASWIGRNRKRTRRSRSRGRSTARYDEVQCESRARPHPAPPRRCGGSGARRAGAGPRPGADRRNRRPGLPARGARMPRPLGAAAR